MSRFNNIGSNRTSDHEPSGFTIIELLIATSVFSIIILVTVGAFFLIASQFFKGIVLTQTQQTARKVVDAITSDISNAQNGRLDSPSLIPGTTNLYYFCIGQSARYTYNRYHLVDDQDDPASEDFGLIRDDNGGSCSNPCDFSLPPACAFNYNWEELLGFKMRISKLDLDPPAVGSPFAQLRNLTLTISYGDDNVLKYPNGPNPPFCIGARGSSQYCWVTTLTTSVGEGY